MHKETIIPDFPFGMAGIAISIDAAPAIPLGQDINEEINMWVSNATDVLPFELGFDEFQRALDLELT